MKDELMKVITVLIDVHDSAMLQALKQPIPTCAEFAGIAQDLGYCIDQLRMIAAAPDHSEQTLEMVVDNHFPDAGIMVSASS